MKTRTRRIVVALAISTLLPAVTAAAEDQVTRPFQMTAQSQLVVVVNPSDPNFGTYVAHAEGVASHLGRVTIDEAGILAPVTQGVMTAANGDRLYYAFDTATWVVTFTGGTGRFAGAGGDFTLRAQMTGQVLDPDAGTLTQNFIWTASGKITY